MDVLSHPKLAVGARWLRVEEYIAPSRTRVSDPPNCPVEPEEQTMSSHRQGITYVEVLVVLLLIVIGIAFLIPTRGRYQGASNRVNCASNLRQIGQAMLLYSNDNHGDFPVGPISPGPT